MKGLTIGLFGMYGLYNYGCEAIVRGTYDLIKKSWPNSRIILYTYRTKEDKEIVDDLDIIVKPIPMKSNLFIRRVFNKILRDISVEKQFSRWDSEYVANECDIVFSVGGDIYTIPKYVLDAKKETNYSPIIEFGKTIIKKRPMIIWGASIGPFGNKKKVEDYYFNHLKGINQIFCREKRTYNYLKSNEVKFNLQLCSDPAFYINSSKEKIDLENGKTKIALNLSPLSIKELIGKHYVSFRTDIIDSIINLLSIDNTYIILVPHVISPLSVEDNDLIYLKDIYENIPTEYKDNVRILEDAKGFLGTKEFLRTCDIVIAARMHCAVNAVCEGVPTIFLTYSQKGIGMTNHIYGNTYWSIPLLNIKTELKGKALEMLKNRENISNNIKDRIEQIKSEETKIICLFKSQI